MVTGPCGDSLWLARPCLPPDGSSRQQDLGRWSGGQATGTGRRARGLPPLRGRGGPELVGFLSRWCWRGSPFLPPAPSTPAPGGASSGLDPQPSPGSMPPPARSLAPNPPAPWALPTRQPLTSGSFRKQWLHRCRLLSSPECLFTSFLHSFTLFQNPPWSLAARPEGQDSVPLPRGAWAAGGRQVWGRRLGWGEPRSGPGVVPWGSGGDRAIGSWSPRSWGVGRAQGAWGSGGPTGPAPAHPPLGLAEGAAWGALAPGGSHSPEGRLPQAMRKGEGDVSFGALGPRTAPQWLGAWFQLPTLTQPSGTRQSRCRLWSRRSNPTSLAVRPGQGWGGQGAQAICGSGVAWLPGSRGTQTH